MLLRRHLKFRTLANEAVSREFEAYVTAQTRRRGAALKRRQTATVLWSACVGEAASFGAEPQEREAELWREGGARSVFMSRRESGLQVLR